MWFRILLIATAALELSAPGCLADVATLNGGGAKQQELLLPFNDLLPPLLDSEAGAATTTTTEAFTTHVTKRAIDSITTTLAQSSSTTLPTKKSYYQQQQNNKDLHSNAKLQQPQQKSKILDEQKQHKPHEIQLLSLDLLPPFESAINEAETQQKEHYQTTAKPSVVAKPKQLVAKPSKHVPIIVKPAVPVKPVHLPSSVVKPTNIHQTNTVKQHQQQQQQQQHHHAAAAQVLPQHFADYSYQQTTRRPARGPLPTLTPFPKHFRK